MASEEVSVTGIHTLLPIPQGTPFYTSIETQNTGGSVVKDFLAVFGTYDSSTGEFTVYWGHVATNVTINSGSDVNDVPCEAISVGTWDVLGAIGTYDEAAGTFTIESAVVVEDLLTITEVTEDDLYERYNTGDDAIPGLYIYGPNWQAQTFTIGNTGVNEDHHVTSVKLKVFRVRSPGTGTVAIYATSGGKPTGSPLCHVDYNFNNLPTYESPEWVEFIFTTNPILSASTQYAIVVCVSDGSAGYDVRWRIDSSSPTYTGGCSQFSNNSGSSWIPDTKKDFMFEEYGEVHCSDYTSQSECEAHGCYWWNGSCHDNPPTCSQLNNETDCVAYGCFWYHGACHAVDQPELCYWIDDKGGPSGLTIPDVFEIVNSYLFETPPTGYSFIPIPQNVFGVMDYYLGFDGDAATGCDYFP